MLKRAKESQNQVMSEMAERMEALQKENEEAKQRQKALEAQLIGIQESQNRAAQENRTLNQKIEELD